MTYLFHVLHHHHGHHENLFQAKYRFSPILTIFLYNTWSSHHFNYKSIKHLSSKVSEILNQNAKDEISTTEYYKDTYVPINVCSKIVPILKWLKDKILIITLKLIIFFSLHILLKYFLIFLCEYKNTIGDASNKSKHHTQKYRKTQQKYRFYDLSH
jgi:hypothetical protein